jgi:hypothetical protein
VIVLRFCDHMYVRIISTRTGETLIELKMIGGGVIVWRRHYQPSESDDLHRIILKTWRLRTDDAAA